jgi:hypothetical protein
MPLFARHARRPAVASVDEDLPDGELTVGVVLEFAAPEVLDELLLLPPHAASEMLASNRMSTMGTDLGRFLWMSRIELPSLVAGSSPALAGVRPTILAADRRVAGTW